MCDHIDYPCCGCGDDMSEFDDDRMDGVDMADEPWDGFQSDAEADADTLASAGHGMDEDYNHYDYGDETPLGEEYGGEG